MPVFEEFPYTNFHELNLDWLLKKMKELEKKVSDPVPREIYAKAEKGKNILFIGDSWTVGTGATNRDTEKFSTVLSRDLGMIEKNYGVGAAGYARPYTFQQQAETAISSLTPEERENTNIIMIVGGVNDLRNIATETFSDVTDAARLLVSTLKPAFPNAIICFAVNMIPVGQTTTMIDWIQSLQQYILTIHDAPVILFDSFTELCISNVEIFAGDMLHPNTDGHSLIAGYLRNGILGGSNDSMFRYIGRIDLTRAGYSFTSGGHIFSDGRMVHFEQTDIVSVAEAGQVLIGTVPEGCRPLNNVNFPIYFSTSGIIGSGVLTAAGNLYTNQNIAQSGYFMLPPFSFPCAN